MKKTWYRTHHNSDQFEKDNEVNRSPSLTIPDQTLTIRDIMRRYASGLSFNGVKTGAFIEEDLPDFKKMDLSEIASFKEYVINNIKEKQNIVTQQMEDKKTRDTLEMYKKWKETETTKQTQPA